MNKSEKTIVRTVAFLISATISASTFALFSSWAWTHLDPTQQDAIAAINTPLIAGQSDRTSAASEPDAARVDKASDYRTVTTRVAHSH
jgi:hypothetical protein